MTKRATHRSNPVVPHHVISIAKCNRPPPGSCDGCVASERGTALAASVNESDAQIAVRRMRDRSESVIRRVVVSNYDLPRAVPLLSAECS